MHTGRELAIHRHRFTCYGWRGEHFVVRCPHPRPWRIRKLRNAQRNPWQICRYTGEGCYEQFMRASTFTRAVALVGALSWLAGPLRHSHRLSPPRLPGWPTNGGWPPTRTDDR